MSADKYPSIFSHQVEAIVYICFCPYGEPVCRLVYSVPAGSTPVPAFGPNGPSGRRLTPVSVA